MKKSLIVILISCLLSGMVNAQHKTSMNVNDLSSSIEKYIKANYTGYKTVEAFKYDLIYEMMIHKGDTSRNLIFDANGKYLYKEAEADKAKMPLQLRTTIATKDVEETVTKYISRNYKGYKLTEAYKYSEIYMAKIVKGESSETLYFDKDGDFLHMSMNANSAPTATHEVTKQ